MAIDTFVNLAYSTLASGITSGATTLTVATGDGAKFSINGNATIWDSFVVPAPDMAGAAPEIVRITGISGDVLTITRGQESISAIAHNTAGHTYSIMQGVTALTLNKLMDKTGDTMTGPLTLTSGFRPPQSGIKTGTYTITTADFVIPFNVTGGAFTITLPGAAAAGKQVVALIGVGSGANNLTLAAGGGDTVAGGATTTVTSTQSRWYQSDGVSAWTKIV